MQSAVHGLRAVGLTFVLFLVCAEAITNVYDESGWTKASWAQWKIPPVLTNPTDANPALLKYLQLKDSRSISPRNSLDGPMPRRAWDTNSDPFLIGPDAMDDASLLQPASAAVQCTVCHAVVTRVWQQLVLEVLSGAEEVPQDKLKHHLDSVCDAQLVSSVLSRSVIYKLQGDSGPQQLVFFVVRERRPGHQPTSAEHMAVQHACQSLLVEVGADLLEVLRTQVQAYQQQLRAVLDRHELAALPADALPEELAGQGPVGRHVADSAAGSAAAAAAAVMDTATQVLAQLAAGKPGLTSLANLVGEAARKHAAAAAVAGGAAVVDGGASRSSEGEGGNGAPGAAGRGEKADRGASLEADDSATQADKTPKVQEEQEEEEEEMEGEGQSGAQSRQLQKAAEGQQALKALLSQLMDSMEFQTNADGVSLQLDVQGLEGEEGDPYVDPDELDEEEDEACMDLHPKCKVWASLGECDANPKYMLGWSGHPGHCRRACGVCTPARPKPAVPAKTKVALRPEHAALAADVRAISNGLLQALKNAGCGASKACLTGVAGTSFAAGVVSLKDTPSGTGSPGFVLGKPTFGQPQVEVLPAADQAQLKQQQAAAGKAAAALTELQREVDALLEVELGGKALRLPAEFFTYEYVYKNHTRHYHYEQSVLTENWSMGRYQREAVQMTTVSGGVAVLDDKDLLPNQATAMVTRAWPYIKQVYGQGDECVLANNRRVIRRSEVRIACSPDDKIHLLVREPDFCTYIWVIYSPSLCSIPSFQPTSKSK